MSVAAASGAPTKVAGGATVKRLHISGLTPALTEKDLLSRFSSFGLQVLSIEPWSAQDVGASNVAGPSSKQLPRDSRPYTFLDVSLPVGDTQASAKLDRLRRLLSGTVWKGAKLRIGDAKPDFAQRLEAERKAMANGISDKEKSKKRKRTKLPGTVGNEAPNADKPVTVGEVENGLWGWKKTPAGHLVRPMHMRPAHALPAPQPLKGETNKSVKDGKSASAKGKEKQSSAPAPLAKRGPSAKGKRSGKAAKRAKIITIDPTRYPRSHLTGILLDQTEEIDGFDDVPAGAYWTCKAGRTGSEASSDEDSGDSASESSSHAHGRVRWTLRDKDGKVLRTEMVQPRQRPQANGARNRQAPAARPSTSSSNDSSEDDSLDSDGSSDTEASSADDGAGALTVEPTTKESLFGGEPSSSRAAHLARGNQADTSATWQREAYDPDAESDFSDGYDEAKAAAGIGAISSGDFVSERKGTLGLLASMFGGDLSTEKVADKPPALPVSADSDQSSSSSSDEEDSNGEDASSSAASSSSGPEASARAGVSAAIAESRSRRAALLANAAAAKEQPAAATATSGSYAPIARFVPTGAEEEEEPAAPDASGSSDDKSESESDSSDDEPQTADRMMQDADENAAPLDSQASSAQDGPAADEQEQLGTRYQLNSLKDMFKPKEAALEGGFSLMAGLDIELDDELDFGLDPTAEAADGDDEPAEVSRAAQPVPPESVAGADGASAAIKPLPFPLFDPSNPRELINLLQTSGPYIPFCRTDTEEEIEARWEERKGRLTQEYKRRHREAVKKKKRRVTGNRAAGAAGSGPMRSATRVNDGDL